MPSGSITANGNFPSDSGYPSVIKNSDSNARLHLSGTFDGATVVVQFLADGNTTIGSSGWLDVDGGTYTAIGDDIIHLPNRTTIRLSVTGVGASTAIDYNLV